MKCRIIICSALTIVIFSSITSGQTSRTSERRLELGAAFSVLPICDPDGLCDLFPRTESGFGARASYNLNDHFAFDGEVDFFPRNYRRVVSNFTGGRVIEGLFGLRAGMRKNRLGLFAKVRPGFESSGRAEIAHFPNGNGPDAQNPFGFERVRATQFALDVGGVFEFYPSTRTIIRFDLGDTMVRYPGVQFTHLPDGTVSVKTVYSHKPQFGIGFGIRF